MHVKDRRVLEDASARGRRVAEAADILQVSQLPKRNPKQLSGGHRRLKLSDSRG